MIRLDCCLLGVFFVALLCTQSLAHPGYQKLIPNGKNVIGGKWPGVGHMSPGGGDARNPFGLDFAAADHEWTVELCQKDSDGDLLTNGQELGDPDCVWEPGMIPNRTHHITHPGFAEGHLPPIPDDTCIGVPEAEDVILVNMTFNNYQIPSKQTTYACQRFDMPTTVTSGAHHIVRFDPIIVRKDIVHHLIVFSCDTLPPTTEAWECGLEMPSGCKEFVWGWALGGRSECIPEQAGIPVGANGPGFFVIQMHYNNDLRVSGAVDSSGVQMHITPHLRAFDASVLLSGASEVDIVIPGGRSAFEIVSDCPAFCTEQAFSEAGVFVYAYLMHMHLLGSRMWTEITYANGTKRILGEVPKYDFNAQAWVPLTPPLQLHRGDRLLTHCVYDSSQRNRTTIGGASTEDEMCTANLAYFPRVPGFDLCTNYTDDDGVKMGRCAGFDFYWNSGQKLPICDAEDIPPQTALLATQVLPHCTNGQECSGSCRQAILDWTRASTCVIRNGLKTVLNHCPASQQADCDALSDLFASPCLQLCDSDPVSPQNAQVSLKRRQTLPRQFPTQASNSQGSASSIQIPRRSFNQCDKNRSCQAYACSDLSVAPTPSNPTSKRLLVIAAAITIVGTIALIGAAIFGIARCNRFKKSKVEYLE
jgi:dopamine beta-monooxygenase